MGPVLGRLIIFFLDPAGVGATVDGESARPDVVSLPSGVCSGGAGSGDCGRVGDWQPRVEGAVVLGVEARGGRRGRGGVGGGRGERPVVGFGTGTASFGAESLGAEVVGAGEAGRAMSFSLENSAFTARNPSPYLRRRRREPLGPLSNSSADSRRQRILRKAATTVAGESGSFARAGWGRGLWRLAVARGVPSAIFSSTAVSSSVLTVEISGNSTSGGSSST